MTKICEFCGNEFEPHRSDQKFCCKQCKKKNYYNREDVKERIRSNSIKWYLDNKEYALQRIRKYNKEHPEVHHQASAKYFANNKDICIERNKSVCDAKTICETHNEITYLYFNGIQCVVDTEDVERIMTKGWFVFQDYVKSHDLKCKLHRFIMNCFDDNLDVHHINENTLDNRKENLIILSHSQHSRLHNFLKTRPENRFSRLYIEEYILNSIDTNE